MRNYSLHFNGATVIMLNIDDESIIPRNEAIPLILVPSKDQFSCTDSDICLEHIRWVRSLSLRTTWKSVGKRSNFQLDKYWMIDQDAESVEIYLMNAARARHHFAVHHGWIMGTVQPELECDNFPWLRLRFFCWSYSVASFPGPLDWSHPIRDKIALT